MSISPEDHNCNICYSLFEDAYTAELVPCGHKFCLACTDIFATRFKCPLDNSFIQAIKTYNLTGEVVSNDDITLFLSNLIEKQNKSRVVVLTDLNIAIMSLYPKLISSYKSIETGMDSLVFDLNSASNDPIESALKSVDTTITELFQLLEEHRYLIDTLKSHCCVISKMDTPDYISLDSHRAEITKSRCLTMLIELIDKKINHLSLYLDVAAQKLTTSLHEAFNTENSVTNITEVICKQKATVEMDIDLITRTYLDCIKFFSQINKVSNDRIVKITTRLRSNIKEKQVSIVLSDTRIILENFLTVLKDLCYVVKLLFANYYKARIILTSSYVSTLEMSLNVIQECRIINDLNTVNHLHVRDTLKSFSCAFYGKHQVTVNTIKIVPTITEQLTVITDLMYRGLKDVLGSINNNEQYISLKSLHGYFLRFKRNGLRDNIQSLKTVISKHRDIDYNLKNLFEEITNSLDVYDDLVFSYVLIR